MKPPQLPITLAVKLAAIIVHYEEAKAEPDPAAAAVDLAAAVALRGDDEVRAFMDATENAALLPLKRRAGDAKARGERVKKVRPGAAARRDA